MDAKAFEEHSQALRDELQRANVPADLSRSLVDLHRGPLSSLEAHVTACEYYTALPGDPAGNLTFDDVARLMQESLDDWRVSLRALERVTEYVSDPERLGPASDIAREADWDGLSRRYATTLDLTEKPALMLVDALRVFGRTARSGTLANALKQSGLQYAEVASLNAAAFADAGKADGYGRSQEVVGYGARSLGWGFGAFASGYGAGAIYGSSLYGAGGAAGALAAGGAAMLTGVCIASAGLAAYGVYRACRRLAWDDGNG